MEEALQEEAEKPVEEEEEEDVERSIGISTSFAGEVSHYSAPTTMVFVCEMLSA